MNRSNFFLIPFLFLIAFYDCHSQNLTKIYEKKARYKGNKIQLKKYIDESITPFIVDCIKSDNENNNFVGTDTLILYLMLSPEGVIQAIDGFYSNIKINSEKQELLYSIIIGMTNWKPAIKRKQVNRIRYKWTMYFSWY